MTRHLVAAIALLISASPARAIEQGRLNLEARFETTEATFRESEGVLAGYSGALNTKVRTKSASGELAQGAGLIEAAFGGSFSNESGGGTFPLTPFGTSIVYQPDGGTVRLETRSIAKIVAPPLTIEMNHVSAIDLQVLQGAWSDLESGGEVVAEARGPAVQEFAQKWVAALTKFRGDFTNALLARTGQKAQLVMSGSAVMEPRSMSCRFRKGEVSCRLDAWTAEFRNVLVMN